MDEVRDERPDEEDVSTQTSERNATDCTYRPVTLVEGVERNVSKMAYDLLSLPAFQ